MSFEAFLCAAFSFSIPRKRQRAVERGTRSTSDVNSALGFTTADFISSPLVRQSLTSGQPVRPSCAHHAPLDTPPTPPSLWCAIGYISSSPHRGELKQCGCSERRWDCSARVTVLRHGTIVMCCDPAAQCACRAPCHVVKPQRTLRAQTCRSKGALLNRVKKDEGLA